MSELRFAPEALAESVLDILSQMSEIRRPKIVPAKSSLASVVEMVFWSSLDHYEKTPLRARLFFAPEAALVGSPHIIALVEHRLMSMDSIRRLAPSHPPDGGLLLVEGMDGTLAIRGVLGSYPFGGRGVQPGWLCVESRAPGRIRIFSGLDPILEFTRGHVMQLGDAVHDRTTAESYLIGANPGVEVQHSWPIAGMFVDIGEAIDRQGHGGALWILHPSPTVPDDLSKGYAVDVDASSWRPYDEMREHRTLLNRLAVTVPNADLDMTYATSQWDLARRESFTRTIANLSKVDGAIVVTSSPTVLAFGVIGHFTERPERVLWANRPGHPYEGEEVSPSKFGGSRHQSAIDFCSAHSPAAALVASHDGGITAFGSLEKGTVTGARISTIRRDAEVKSKSKP